MVKLTDGPYLSSQDFTIYGGTLSEIQSHKICRVLELAVRNGVPFISLIDSGGARIQEGVRSLGGYAEIFRRNAQYSGVVPQVSVMLGPCAGGAAYSHALTDLVIMVAKQSFMFLTGPEVIKAVTGEIIDAESLGGAEVHNELLVKFRDGVPESRIQEVTAEKGARIMKVIEGIGVYHLQLRKGVSVEGAVNEFTMLPEVQYAEPNYTLKHRDEQ